MWRESWSGIRKKSKVYPWSTGSNMAKDNFAFWQGSSVINCKNPSILRLSIVYGKDQWKSRQSLEGEDRLVSEFTSTSTIGSNRWGADGVRVENSPRIHHIADLRRDSKHDDWNKTWNRAIPRTNHLHVNVQRHCMVRKRKQKIVYCDFPQCSRKCKMIRARSLVVSWARIGNEDGGVADMCEELAWEITKCSEGTERDHGNANRIVDNKSNSSDR